MAGLAATAAFVSTFEPSERAKAAGAPVEIDIADLKPGEIVIIDVEGEGADAKFTFTGAPKSTTPDTPENLTEAPSV